MPLLCYGCVLVQGLDGRTVLGRVWGTAGYDIPLSDEKMNVWVYFWKVVLKCGQMAFYGYEMKNGGNEHNDASQIT